MTNGAVLFPIGSPISFRNPPPHLVISGTVGDCKVGAFSARDTFFIFLYKYSSDIRDFLPKFRKFEKHVR